VASADLFVFPSMTETFGNVVTEALSSGVPVVAYDHAAASQLLQPGVNGQHVPLGQERDTLLSGADLTFSQGPVWVQAEWMRLNSAPTSGADPRRSMGTSLELAYKLPWTVNDTAFQLAARGERTDPDLDTDDDDFTVAAFGVNVLPSSPIRVSAFGQATFYADPVTGDASVGSEVQLRGTLAF
jgi:hypothetical protein